MKTITLTAPSAWAPAIVNGDYSGLSATERKQLNTFLALNGVSFADCLDCKDAGFVRMHDAYAVVPFPADCQTYVFPISVQPI